MESSSHQTAASTLALLEERLCRVDYILHGDKPSTETTSADTNNRPTLSATERLRKLERNLANLTAKSPTAASIVDLQMHHPAVFNTSPSTAASPQLPPPALASLILAHASQIQTTTTSLQTLSSQSSIPDSNALAKLIAQQARLDQARQKQDEQAREFAELRARSARLVETWYEEGVLGMGEKWAAWEEKLREGEILVRRREARVKREKEGVV